MSHHQTISTGAPQAAVTNTEHNTVDPIMDDLQTRQVIPSKAGIRQRRARIGLRGGRYREYTLAEKLAARTIADPSGCLLAHGSPLHSGHVVLSIGSPSRKPYVRVRAHVFAWEHAHGRTVPPGLVIAHTCDRPNCVRVEHLVLTTQAENVRDSIRKGRYKTFGIQKLNQYQVLAIRDASANGEPQGTIAARFGIARNTVSSIVNHKSWAHLTKPLDGPQPVRTETVELPFYASAVDSSTEKAEL